MNIFSKENRRRMLFTVTLILLTAVLSFGFVSRAVEYLAVKQELERLSDNYRTIGWLTSADGNIATGAELIEESPYVETADARGFLWGTLTDLYNADLQGRREGYWYNEYGVNNAEVLFCGTLKYVDEDWYERTDMPGQEEKEASRLIFTVSERIYGYPDYAPEGEDITLVYTDEMLESEGWELPELLIGESYLIRAYYSDDRNGPWNGYELWASAAGGHALTALPLQGNKLFLTAEEGNDVLPALISDERMQFDELNRHSMNVIATRDMSAMPNAQDVQKRMFLTDGRWLDGIDSNTGAAVCVVHKDFADARGLQVGDTIELTFRNAQLSLGYALGEQDVTEWQTYESETRQYVIVGIFDYMPLNELIHNFSEENMELYIPYGSVSEAYIKSRGMISQYFSFVLRNPQDTDAFLSEVQGPLTELGIRVQLIENDWEHFAVSANAMQQTARTDVLVLAGVLCLGFVLITFLYIRQNRKSLCIARALGVPKAKCIRMCLSPILYMSVIGIGAGALFAWRYAIGEAEQMLTGMQEHIEMSLSIWWLVGIMFVLEFLLTTSTAVGILLLARRPVMELLHDVAGGQKRMKTSETYNVARNRERDALESIRMGEQSAGDEPGGRQPATGASRVEGQLSLPIATGKRKGTASSCRFVLRHIRRRPVHTILVAAVALAFLATVTWMQVSIVMDTAEVERLYGTTEIDGELVKRDITVTSGSSGAYLTQDMLEWLQESGYVRELYAEAADVMGMEVTSVNRFTYETTLLQRIGTEIPVRSMTDVERFCEVNHVEIDYVDGYGPELFTADWEYLDPDFGMVSLRNNTPIIVPEAWMELYGLEFGQRIDISMISGGWKRNVSPGPVIAGCIRYADVGDGISRGEWDKVLIPLSVLEHFKEMRDWTYSSLQFTVNPAFNREIDMVKAEIEAQLKNPRMALADADVMLWTSELRQVVEPFEKNLDLMKLLFPVTVAISAIAGGGLIFLLLQQRTEEAALLRVLGSSRGRTRRMLFAEPVLLSLLGLLIGGCVVYYSMPEISTRQILMFAGTYLGGCLIGALAGTIHITRKKPLELLQVKE
ncbi:MAG: hypothetical protein NC254_03790 [bacterium]|nr:hypothetical protein [bacterium]